MVTIIGTGIAGLSCALALAPRPVTLLTATPLPASGSSPLAQGGIAAVLGTDDSLAAHAADTRYAGAGLTVPERVDQLVRDGQGAVAQLIAAGFPADRGPDGAVQLGREGAHGRARIIHAGGDATGRILVDSLLARVAAAPSITIETGMRAVDLVVHRGRVTGVLVHGPQGWDVRPGPVVLACGGAGALWAETTNAPESVGAGLALAARAGAVLADLEFMQFHPTALAVGGSRLPLLSEALRGAGARLLDAQGRAFMADEHELADLAPRDVVARAIGRRRQGGEAVYLDLRPALAERDFPQAVAACAAHGLDPHREPVPVTPAAHYHMGGVAADLDGRTSLDGLWAIGETAATGVHGANRLASNSLLEALVMGRRAAMALADRPAGRPGPVSAPEVRDFGDTAGRVQALMTTAVALTRDETGLVAALHDLGQLPPPPAGATDVDAWARARDMLLAGRLIALAALRRRESRGAHYRADHPQPRTDWAFRQELTLADLAAPFAGAGRVAL